LAILVKKKGYKVIGIDIDDLKIQTINEGKSPFKDEKLAQDLRNTPIEATTDFDVIQKASIVVVCVPTPVHEDHEPNLKPLEDAVASIASHLQKGALLIIESTVNPGVCENIVLPIIQEKTNFTPGVDFYLAHCPERINPGDPKWNVENINRVLGSFEKIGLEKAKTFYENILDAQIKTMKSLKEAEAVKVVENTFRDINIAFVNELAMSFGKMGIDVVNVINGAATKPFAFMAHYPGCGVGGHCIPVDPYYLIKYGKENGYEHKFISLAREINSGMPEFTVNELERLLQQKDIQLVGSTIAVLGLAYKGEVDDCRESPSFEIIKLLQEKGVEVKIYDPFVLKKSNTKSVEDVLEGSVGAIIATSHKVFCNLTAETLEQSGIKVLVDGKNCLERSLVENVGVTYVGIGR